MTTLDRETLREELGQPGEAASNKSIRALDEHCEQFLALSPFVVVATADARGRTDASPRGGPPGFVRALSSTRVALGELPGNRLFDGAQNLAENPYAALLVMVPGVIETLRIEGSAHLSRDETIRAAVALDGRLPWGALVVDVEAAFTHCGKAFKRSRLWEPESWPTLDRRPRMGAVIADHMRQPGPVDRGPEPGPDRTAEEVQAGLDDSYAHRLWEA
ncbi:MSMEG_1061 family FMN-dependent PPOX-type flavoprotein [Nocardioides sp. AE5]|uniref:MSMEG_1061 family FMN-dependent PPOX-type flavoprotein n=1 Tax=Nocardioides sp. AE5 TaxID=2962573 RepID=UPI002881571A|nr:MSMEG_1061 family FMN-dependent PPOX-type flavoprotein [Nocardioides sp. AE5]MDT0200377.1 pyridoxamine 5'-phosphate oxidase family protein [Nocardioides sp. AE5]